MRHRQQHAGRVEELIMAGRVVLRVIGILLMIIGVVFAAGGGLLMGLFGTSNTLASGVHRLSTPTAAFTSPLDDVHGTFDTVDTRPFEPTLSLSATRIDKDLFIGVGPSAAVDNYLNGVPLERITDLSLKPYHLDTERSTGSTVATPPDQQSFWIARASGATPALTWKIVSGSYRIVLMNVDASPAVNADARASLHIPHMFAIGVGVLVGGLVALAIGITLLIVASSMKRRAGVSAPPQGAWGQPAPQGPQPQEPWRQPQAQQPWQQSPQGPSQEPPPQSSWGEAPAPQAPQGEAPRQEPWRQPPPQSAWGQPPEEQPRQPPP
jgi:hypothetical protein